MRSTVKTISPALTGDVHTKCSCIGSVLQEGGRRVMGLTLKNRHISSYIEQAWVWEYYVGGWLGWRSSRGQCIQLIPEFLPRLLFATWTEGAVDNAT